MSINDIYEIQTQNFLTLLRSIWGECGGSVVRILSLRPLKAYSLAVRGLNPARWSKLPSRVLAT